MTTAWVAIFGYPLTHTLSPVFQNAGFKALGLDWRYRAVPVAEADFLSRLEAFKADPRSMGANITIPHKQLAAAAVGWKSSQAKAVGAVNTLYRRGRGWAGANTDVDGFLEACRRANRSLRGSKVLLLGAGGSARALAYACLKARADSVLVCARDAAKVREFCAGLRLGRARPAGGPWLSQARAFETQLKKADWIINTLPPSSGLAARLAKMVPSLPARATVADITYQPVLTPLLRAAARRRLATVSGLSMLLEQGLLSFQLWTGRPAPRAAMAAALENVLRKNSVK